MSIVENPPNPTQDRLIKVWSFVQNANGTFSPAPSSGGGGGGNTNITGINGIAPALTNPLPVELSDGTNPFGTAGNPLSVNVITGGGSNASVGATGSAVPASATYEGLNVAGTMRGATGVNPSGSIFAQQVDLASILGVTIVAASAGVQKVGIAGATGTTLDGTAGSPSAGVVTVQGVGGGTAVPVSGNVTIVGNKTNNNAAPGATNVGTLPAIANAAAPTWTEGDQVAISVDLSGAQRENVAEWGGTAVSASPASGVPATGAEVAPVVKPIQRKAAAISNNTPLGANATFTSPWIDTQATGGYWLVAQVFSDQTSALNFPVFQGSNDTGNASFTTTLGVPVGTAGGAGGFASANVLCILSAFCPYRYWRIVYKNGATPQGSFALSAVEATLPPGVLYGATQFPQLGNTLIPNTWQVAAVGPTGALLTAFNTDLNSGSLDGVNFSEGLLNPGGTRVSLCTTSMLSTSGSASTAGSVVQRTPAVFKTTQATASGNTALWTPTTGKKFRLMRFMVQVTGNSTTASGVVVTVSFQDSASAMNIAMDVFVPASSLGTGDDFIGPWVDLGNGFLSAAANNVLNVNLSSTLATGNVRVTCCGTEE